MYITFAELKEASAYEPADWDGLNARRPNTVASWLRLTQSAIDDPLRLRYAVPFVTTPPSQAPDPALAPATLKRWQIALMDARFLRMRRETGADVSEDADLLAEADAVRKEIEAAADTSNEPHAELPLRADTTATGVSRGGPLMATFATFHGFFDAQAERRDAEGW